MSSKTRSLAFPTTSTAASPQPSGKPVERVGLLLRERDGFTDAVERIGKLAREVGAEVSNEDPELVVVLGGDGTMLRAFHEYLGHGVPVLGVNFGRFGFLASMQPEALETGLRRVLAGEYVVIELPTLEFEHAGKRSVAVNDVVAATSEVGRVSEVEWAIGGEPLGTVLADGMIVATPTGSTAYNLSNNGPVLMWGIDAMTVTFIAPHSLVAHPLVVPRGRDVVVTNRNLEMPLALIADGQRVGELEPGADVAVSLGPQRSLLATLPDATFLTRFRSAFG